MKKKKLILANLTLQEIQKLGRCERKPVKSKERKDVSKLFRLLMGLDKTSIIEISPEKSLCFCGNEIPSKVRKPIDFNKVAEKILKNV